MGPEVGPAFQRLSRGTLFSNLGVRLAETVEVGQYNKKCVFFWHFGRGITYTIRVFVVFARFAFLSRVGARDLGIPAFAPRSGPPHARAPGPQMIWVAPGSSLASHVYWNDFSLTTFLASYSQRRGFAAGFGTIL
eukprot:gene14659-biopygen586